MQVYSQKFKSRKVNSSFLYFRKAADDLKIILCDNRASTETLSSRIDKITILNL